MIHPHPAAIGEFDFAPGLRIERRIDAAETEAVTDRWKFGRWMLGHVPAGGKKLPAGFLDGLAEATGKSRSELKYRRQFAERYPSGEALANVLANHPSWHDIVNSALASGDCGQDSQARAQLTRDEAKWLAVGREAEAVAAKHGIELPDEHMRQAGFRLVNEEAAEAALANGETDKAAELLGFKMRYSHSRSAPAPKPEKLPDHEIPAALAASERNKAESDALRASKGLPPVRESSTAAGWRRRLAEMEEAARRREGRVIASLRKLRDDYETASERAILDAAIGLLMQADAKPTIEGAEPRTPVQNVEPLRSPPTASPGELPPVTGLSLLPEPVLVELEALVAA